MGWMNLDFGFSLTRGPLLPRDFRRYQGNKITFQNSLNVKALKYFSNFDFNHVGGEHRDDGAERGEGGGAAGHEGELLEVLHRQGQEAAQGEHI